MKFSVSGLVLAQAVAVAVGLSSSAPFATSATSPVATVTAAIGKPALKASSPRVLNDVTSKGPPGGGIQQQLASFNSLDFHGMSWFFAKTLSYGQSLNFNAFKGPNFGPFTANFVCDSSTGATLQISVTNTNSYPITVHGFAVSGDSVTAQTLNSGETSSFSVFSSAAVGTLASNSRGSLLTSNGYYVGLDTDGFLLSAGADGMPNSDCSVAGFIYYAHPHHHGYYTGLLSSNVDLSTTSEDSSSSSTLLLSGVILGVVLGNVALVATVFALVRNRSLLFHALGLNTMHSSTFSCLPVDDSSSHAPTVTASAVNPMTASPATGTSV
jgi:hypothetical protein